MTKEKTAPKLEEVKALFTENQDVLRKLLQKTVQDILESEMENFLVAGPYERTATRRGYRAGYYSRRLETRMGTLNLKIPQYRQGNFKMELFERHQL